MHTETVRTAFPELAAIDDETLRTGVIQAWEHAMAAHDVEDLSAVPWLPPTQRALDLPDETLVDHVRDVTTLAVAITERLTERRSATLDIEMDTVIAGALVHDVSKLAEFDGMADTDVYRLLGHPYYGVHLVAQTDLPVECAHIVLSHTDRTAVEPATMAATIIRRANEIAAAAIRSRATDDLRTV